MPCEYLYHRRVLPMHLHVSAGNRLLVTTDIGNRRRCYYQHAGLVICVDVLQVSAVAAEPRDALRHGKLVVN